MRFRRASAVAVGIALAMLAAAAFGGILASGPEQASTNGGRSPQQLAALEALGIHKATAGATVDELERAARAGSSVDAWTRLGFAALQQVRETGDPSGYGRAGRAFDRALELDGGSYPALVGRATLAAGRHQFVLARRDAQAAVRVQPRSTAALGILGDAELEIGDYPAAFATFDRMVALKPSLSSYSRVSYARELLGDREGAIQALTFAIDASSETPEHVAFALVHRGNLLLDEGHVDAAAADFAAALRVRPDFAPALGGRASVRLARGDTDGAVADEQHASDVGASAEFPIALAELLRRQGRLDEARLADGVADSMIERERAAGVQVDLEYAVRQLDRGRDPVAALREIRSVRRAGRHGIQVDDATAWALVRMGRCAAARPWSQRALRLGTRDGLKLFHRAEVERCLGNDAAARLWYRRALTADPYFSVRYAPRARAALGA